MYHGELEHSQALVRHWQPHKLSSLLLTHLRSELVVSCFVQGTVLHTTHPATTSTWSVFCLGEVHSLVRETAIERLIIKHSEKYFNRTLNASVDKQSTGKNDSN